MQLFRMLAVALIAWSSVAVGKAAQATERRLALVVGESANTDKPLATAANDAGLIAQTLQAAGFDVTGARDLEEEALKRAFRDFLDKAASAGPDTVAFIYFAGYGLQLEGENYLVPIDVRVARDADVPLRALRVSDYLKPLAASGAKLSVVVLDAARPNPFQMSGQPLAGGLALYEPGANALLAFNAAPGTVAPDEKGPYGAYAHALAEMIRDGGSPLMQIFQNVRLRVSDNTKGAQIPWNSAKIDTDFIFFQRIEGAPARADDDAAQLAQPISALGPEAGFSAALRRDTLQGYQDYVATYPAAPYAERARAIVAARREALTWRRSRVVDTPNAYWSYLRLYPKGPHAWDARRRLAQLSSELEPPSSFEMIDYAYPPPPPEEIVFVEQPVVSFDDPVWGFVPPPPVYFLPPPPPNFIILPPPVVIAQPYVLPAPPFVPIPVWQRPPIYVAPPPDNLIFRNVHNQIVIDQQVNNFVVRNPQGQVISTGGLTAAGTGAAGLAIGAALPHFIARRPPGAPPPGGAPTAQPPRQGPAEAEKIAPAPQEGHAPSGGGVTALPGAGSKNALPMGGPEPRRGALPSEGGAPLHGPKMPPGGPALAPGGEAGPAPKPAEPRSALKAHSAAPVEPGGQRGPRNETAATPRQPFEHMPDTSSEPIRRHMQNTPGGAMAPREMAPERPQPNMRERGVTPLERMPPMRESAPPALMGPRIMSPPPTSHAPSPPMMHGQPSVDRGSPMGIRIPPPAAPRMMGPPSVPQPHAGSGGDGGERRGGPHGGDSRGPGGPGGFGGMR
ncbi:MAG: caspase family protein [Methylocystis sp.]|uniref:caspase family protein n=1 Tax=Methylocystis sp. TaxID=1911079 RepID=UPI00393CFA33